MVCSEGKRITLKEVMNHKWLKSKSACSEEVKSFMTNITPNYDDPIEAKLD